MLRHLEIFTLLFHHGLLEAFLPPGPFGLVLGHPNYVLLFNCEKPEKMDIGH